MRFATKWATCTVHGIRDVTPAIREFVLRPEGSNIENYAIGSHINVGVLIDGRPETRSYSLVGDGNPDGYRIAARRAAATRGGRALLPGRRRASGRLPDCGPACGRQPRRLTLYVVAEAGRAHRNI